MAFAALIPWKYVAIVAAALFAFWFVRDLGVQSANAKWEIAMAKERERQSEVTTIYRESSQILASQLLDSQLSRGNLVRRLQDEARNAPNANRICLDVDSVLRLNTLSGRPATD